MLPGVDENVVRPLAIERAEDGGNLHEVGARARHDNDFHQFRDGFGRSECNCIRLRNMRARQAVVNRGC